jgi:hypothetical protein
LTIVGADAVMRNFRSLRIPLEHLGMRVYRDMLS